MKGFLIELWDTFKVVAIIPCAIILVEIVLYTWDNLADILEWITR